MVKCGLNLIHCELSIDRIRELNMNQAAFSSRMSNDAAMSFLV